MKRAGFVHALFPRGRTSPLANLILAIGGVYISQSMVSMIAMQSLPALLREAGVPLEMIGMSALFMAPWVLKFLWAPYVERVRLPTGKPERRSRWIIVGGQMMIAAVCVAVALFHWNTPLSDIDPLGLFLAFIVAAVFASTVDIACEGMVVDHLNASERHLGNSAHVGGGYIGFLLGANVFLILCSRFGVSVALLCVGLILVVLSSPIVRFRERTRDIAQQAHRPSLSYAFHRKEVRFGLVVIFTLEAGLRTVTELVGPMLIDRGASLEHVGWMFGGFTIGAGLLGTFVGAILVKRLGAWKAVFTAYGCQALVFALLALAAHSDFRILTVLIGTKYALMACGLVAAYSALLGLSSPKQSGVDFTLFQCANALIAMIGGLLGGWLAGQWGYSFCFAIAAAFAATATLGVAIRTRALGYWSAVDKSDRQTMTGIQREIET